MTDSQSPYRFSKAPFAGLLALYILYLAKQKNIAFDVLKLKDLFTSFDIRYFKGFIAATRSAELVNYKTHKNIYNVLQFDDDIGEMIEKIVNEKAILFDDIAGHDIDDEYSWQNRVIEVEAFFE